MKIENDIKLDFSDVLLRPKRSTLSSRSEVTLLREIKFIHSKQTWKGIPIIASNMDTIGTIEMLEALSEYKILTCLHKYINIEELIDYFQQKIVINSSLDKAQNSEDHPINYMALSTGISESDWNKLNENIYKLKQNDYNLKFICIDVANGYMIKLIEFCKRVREKYPKITIIAGNVVTREVVEELIINGKVDIVKVGIGSGSVCTTRLQTGVGMPQLSAVLECADAAHGVGGCIISDGGAKVPGDIVKAFGGGADFVMGGSIFSGHEECAGELIEDKQGNKWKIFYGMSSNTAMDKYHGGVARYRSSEGKTVKIPFKGPVQFTVDSILGGIRSACTYVGARRLKDLPKCTTFVRVNNQVNNIYSSAKYKSIY